MVTLKDGVLRPAYHDELSYLLAGDTFAHGRLANPPHPLWQHFESFHVLQQPTYASKYPPGQGLVLALGQLLGDPIVGVWIGVALMAGAVTWMLLGYTAPAWAVFGGLLTIVQIGLVSYWSRGYWGGAVAAFGGALVFGALPRILRRRARWVKPAIVLALGLVVLANTRPLEGALVSLAAAVPLGLWLCGRGRGRERPVPSSSERWLRVAAPIVLVLAIGAAAICRYNQVVTGDPLRLPYSVYNDQYLGAPFFVLQPLPTPPEYRHEILRRFFVDFERSEIESQSTLAGWARTRLSRLDRTRAVLLGPLLTVPLLVLPWSRRLRGVPLALGGVAMLLVAVAITTHHLPHYAAPAFPLVLLIVVQGWRFLVLSVVRRQRGGRRRRRNLLLAAVLFAAMATRILVADPVVRVAEARSGNRAKASVEQHLESLGGKHLVFVRHGPFGEIHDEWVWNGADIDGRTIVYARAMEAAEDAELRAYYPDRQAWRVEIGRDRAGVVDFEPYLDPNTSVTPP